MADQITLTLQRRQVVGKKARRLRKEGLIPGNVYGRGRQSIPVQLNALEFRRALKGHGAATILRLALDGTTDAAVIRHMQHEPVTGALQHIDFMHIEMSEPMRARIPLRLEGEAPAVKSGDGILLHLLEAVEVEALPANLPQAIVLDITPLTEVNQALHVSDARVPGGVTVLTDPAELVAKIERPRIVVEAEEPTPAAAAPAQAPTEESATEPGAGSTAE
jgi:large subunit ribosomal protein L25